MSRSHSDCLESVANVEIFFFFFDFFFDFSSPPLGARVPAVNGNRNSRSGFSGAEDLPLFPPRGQRVVSVAPGRGGEGGGAAREGGSREGGSREERERRVELEREGGNRSISMEMGLIFDEGKAGPASGMRLMN